MSEHAQPVRAALERLFDTVRAGGPERLAPLLAVDDPQDPMRHLRAACDYAREHDRRSADALHRRIAGWLECDRIVWGEFLTSDESEGLWLAQEVSFMTGPDGPRRYFGFLLIDGHYLLGDIDQ